MRTLRTRLFVEELESRLTPTGTSLLAAVPNTSNGIYAYADQVQTGLSDSLVRFIATHFAGTEKLTATENARYLAANPNWMLLHYQLATASGPAQYIVNGQWGSDWGTVNTHEDWFMHNAAGQRLHSSEFNWDQNDISNPAWRQYWLNSVINNMRATGSDGVFADSFEAGIGSWWYDQSDVRFAGTNSANPAYWPGGVTWLSQLQNLIDYMVAGLHATPEQFLYLPNAGSMVTGWANLDYSHIDGGLLENFGQWGGGSWQSGEVSDWVLAMNRALPLTGAGKMIMMEPVVDANPASALGLQERGFYLGTYLLIKGDHTFINMPTPSGYSSTPYYPEYGIDLGPAVTALATNVSQYLWNGVYRRDFQNGLVLVNPGSTSITINIGPGYELVSASGGGDLTSSSIDTAGNYIGGSLSHQSVTSVTLAPGSAAILLKSGASSGSGTAANQSPILAAIANQTVNEGSLLQFTVSASDLDAGQTLTYSLAAGAPSGAGINPVTGVFSWQPADGAASASVTVIVADNGSPSLSDAKSFTITVNNLAPTASFSAPTSVSVGATATVSFTNQLDPSSADVAAGFKYSYDLNNDGIFEVANVSAAGQSFTFSTAGTYTLRGRITDKDGGSTTYTKTVSVNPVSTINFIVTYSPTTVAGNAHTLTVTVKNSSGMQLSNYRGTIHFVSNDPQAVLPADYTFTAADAGRHSFLATLKTAGTRSISAIDTANSSTQGTVSGIIVNPAAAKLLRIAGPTTVTRGVAATLTVTALDAYGNVATDYRGTVNFTSSDTTAGLPASYNFTSGDAGVHTFTVTFKTPGLQWLTVRDKNSSSIFGTLAAITVL